MILAVLVAALALAQVEVDDPTDCVDVGAVQQALEGIDGAQRHLVRIAVLPEGEARGLHIDWVGLAERDLQVQAADCDGVPLLVALATERVLAELPSELRARKSALETSVGGLVGSGVDHWAPRVGVWLDASSRARWAGSFGAAAHIGTQAAGAGSTRIVGLDLRASLVRRLGQVAVRAGAGLGGAAGSGTGLAQSRTALLPRAVGRVGATTEGKVQGGLFAEVALVRPVWSVAGGQASPDPLVRLEFELGARVRDDRRLGRAQWGR